MDTTCKVVIDNNIFLDLFLKRELFFDNALKIMNMLDNGELTGLVNSNSITDIYYFLKKEYGHKKALEFIEAIDNSATIVKVGRNDIMNSMLLNFNDLEDSLVSYCAEREKADYIVTRNGKDFLESRIEALSPEEFLKKTKIR